MIISQRLVRKICVTCKKEFEPSKIESEYLASIGFYLVIQNLKYIRELVVLSVRILVT